MNSAIVVGPYKNYIKTDVKKADEQLRIYVATIQEEYIRISLLLKISKLLLKKAMKSKSLIGQKVEAINSRFTHEYLGANLIP